MITVESKCPLEGVEAAICRAAQKHGVHVVAITPFSSLFSDATQPLADAISFTLCQPELFVALLSAEPRFAAFLPCRIAAVRHGEGVVLETISPKRFCALLERTDLERVVAPLETLLRELMEDVAHRQVTRTPQASAAHSLLGAREGQGSMRASLPQRIDCHGTKIEDLAGTGKVDAPGG